ncbi:hypothetical protein LCGC14_1440730 [marine sediment metagenome]|uniref:DNA (cytosine-5-)-methyltransferase n=1 Tax=marine sediment metagenome TaxID=412755 RepID=A0A0F9MMQ7_9ZZZZ
MRELSLFSGAGGGLLGTHHLLGWQTIGFVEYDDYCQRVIAQRIKDGLLDEAPIFGDIRTFTDSGCAELYRGVTDVITAGFPCQPFSFVGSREGEKSVSNLWPETISTIRIVRPTYCFLENTANLLNYQYFGTILSDLAKSGYNVRWRLLSAAELGAPNIRNRAWLVAYANSKRFQTCGNVRISKSKRVACWWSSKEYIYKIKKYSSSGGRYPKSAKPGMDRILLNDVPHRVDRLKAIGNGQVPQVAATAWEILKP